MASPRTACDVAAIFDPFRNAVHTLLQSLVLGEDVLITGADSIGIMATALVRDLGARYEVVSNVNLFRLNMAGKMGATLTLDVSRQWIAEAQQRRGMLESFDVGLGMSDNPAAFNEMLENKCDGGSIAMLGIPEQEPAIGWNTVVTI